MRPITCKVTCFPQWFFVCRYVTRTVDLPYLPFQYHLSETRPLSLERTSISLARKLLILAQPVLIPLSQAEMSKGDSEGVWPCLWPEPNDAIPRATTTTLLVIAIAALGFFSFRRNKNGTAPLPPGPRGVPVLGYLPFLGTELHQKFTELAETYGPIYKLWLGSKLFVVINSPLLAKEIVRDKDTTFANRDPNIATIIGSYGGRDITFSSQGSYWRNLRKLFVRQMMSSVSLDACYGLRRQEVRKAVSNLYKKSGVPVDIGESALLIMINVMMAMLWGGTLKGEKSEAMGTEFRNVVAKLMVLATSPNISDFFPALAWLDLQGVARDMKRVHRWFDDFIQSAIDCATKGRTNELFKQEDGESKGNEQKKDFLQIFLDMEMDLEDNKSPMDKNGALKAILMDIVVGGTDTTSTTVEWVMAELLQNRNVMKKVVQELTEVVGEDKMVEEQHLPKLKYLNAVIKETFRLHPVLPLLVPRMPHASCTVGGYTIPKGSNIFLNVGYIQRDPKIWDKSSEFIPERFLEDPSNYDLSGNNFTYMPFGSGRRVCAGLALAERMLPYVLASLLHLFDWELPPGAQLEFSDKFGLVVKKMKPLVAIPRPRLSTPELYMSG